MPVDLGSGLGIFIQIITAYNEARAFRERSILRRIFDTLLSHFFEVISDKETESLAFDGSGLFHLFHEQRAVAVLHRGCHTYQRACSHVSQFTCLRQAEHLIRRGTAHVGLVVDADAVREQVALREADTVAQGLLRLDAIIKRHDRFVKLRLCCWIVCFRTLRAILREALGWLAAFLLDPRPVRACIVKCFEFDAGFTLAASEERVAYELSVHEVSVRYLCNM